MIFTISSDLRDYMDSKKKTHIVVEVAESNASDFEVTEIFYRLCNLSHAKYLMDKGYKESPLYLEETLDDEVGEATDMKVLLKPYKFEIEEKVHFYRKKHFLFKSLKAEGIKL